MAGDGSVTGGWASFYSVSGFNNQTGEGSQGDSSHLTKFDGAAVNLTFVGVLHRPVASFCRLN
jgi:hypothetical protein